MLRLPITSCFVVIFCDADLVDYGIESGIVTKDNITLNINADNL